MSNYRERLWPAPWLFISTALVIPASLLVFQPINVVVGIVTGVVLYLGCAGLLLLASPVIEVTDATFKAGRANVPLESVGEVAVFRGADATLERGQRLDARAWLLIRGWVDPVVKVQITDAADPVPYWLVSTRRPESVAEAITLSKQRTPGK